MAAVSGLSNHHCTFFRDKSVLTLPCFATAKIFPKRFLTPYFGTLEVLPALFTQMQLPRLLKVPQQRYLIKALILTAPARGTFQVLTCC